MEKEKIILIFLGLMISQCFGLTYIGDKKLCCIDSHNQEVCLSNNMSVNFNNSDLSCNLQEKDYQINGSNLMDLPTMIFGLLTSLAIIYIFLIITKRR
jgi:hypothetical protein